MLFAQQTGDAVFRRYHDAVFERFWQRALDIENPDAIAAVQSLTRDKEREVRDAATRALRPRTSTPMRQPARASW